MNLKGIDQKVFNDIFRKLSKTAWVTMRGSKSKTTNYDPFRDTGYAKSFDNAIPVKVITKPLSAGSLMHKELGLVKTGAIQIILKKSDINLIKNSEKLVYNDIEYYIYDDAVGNKFQEFPTDFSKYTKIIVFRKDT